ncbi:MAG TPA: SDR family NAD(P)-dependent oxidoreductase [Candidatus Binatus sp.]|uniref:SDR family NAD(P)-dependent oxidoreductase n=1 Tax=Candidatus Binatus sp. TaxID=2811406 RepID=UPI002B4A56E3|nr:SDR family NAD(P)-dependent oxidoreductase [Candidatus Binatus sp.]HKN14999.1 SDR family NAD(P)-dependent oxidoreductase [Candidatus Binatus sp.]
MAKTFGAESTADEVLEGINLSGKRVLVTGVSAGLGVEAARSLVAHGATVVGTARDLAKARRALAEAGNPPVDLVEVDLASLSSVRKAASDLIARAKPFDVIIANAGVMACPQGKTQDGFETQFGTNHLGHFVFINRLVPLLKSGARVVTLSSGGHQISDVDIEDPNFEHTPYQAFTAYGRSKTANILYAVALDSRLKARGVRATAVHPGGIQTELGRHLTPELIEQMMARVNRGAKSGQAPAFRFKTVPQGSATSVWAGFVAPADAVGGRYCEDCHVCEVNDDATSRVGVRSYALNLDRANALWRKSEEMVGERFSL